MLRVLNVLLWATVVIGVFVGVVGWQQHAEFASTVRDRVALAQSTSNEARLFQAQVRARGEAWARSTEGQIFRRRLSERAHTLEVAAEPDARRVPPGFFLLDVCLVLCSVVGLLIVRRYTLAGGPVATMQEATDEELAAASESETAARRIVTRFAPRGRV
jgi:hypothetical protein